MKPSKYESVTKKALCAIAVSSLLIACGGGGGGGGSSSSDSDASSSSSNSNNSDVVTSSPVDYSPSADKKMSEADSSAELYVEQNFNFGFSEKVSVSVFAVSMDDEVLSDATLSIYSVPSDVEDWSDDLLEQASLIAKGRTDSNGEFSRNIELYGQSDKLLLVLNTVGIENKHVVAVSDNNVEFTFQ